MSWKQLASFEQNLRCALADYEWERASQIIAELVGRIRSEREPMPEPYGKSLLSALRESRRFRLMVDLAEALLEAGCQAPQVERQYAQALIDLGHLVPAERMLAHLRDRAKGTPEESEMRGLSARVHKQTYLNVRPSRSARNSAHLQDALIRYLSVYREDPEHNLWHGINSVALAEVARRDGVTVRGTGSIKAVARKIVEILDEREKGAVEGLSCWDLATYLEVNVALGNYSRAVELALKYGGRRDVSPFAIGSTLRQLTEVWGLVESRRPGAQLLPVLRAALLRKQGGSLRVSAGELSTESKPAVRTGLEKLFGASRCQTLRWYQLGLERARSIARVERLNGLGFGTGWLVKGEDFFPNQHGKLLVLTNAHVIGTGRRGETALVASEARAHFQILNRVCDIDQIVWSSPPGQYDATFVSLKTQPEGAQPLTMCERPVRRDDPAPRLYIIGHPGGRDLEFSLDDCQLLAVTSRILHYRTPTEPGSSGSPVFEDQDWTVVGLHHAGKSDMPRLDGHPGTYEANEGISIQAIRRATMSSAVVRAKSASE